MALITVLEKQGKEALFISLLDHHMREEAKAAQKDNYARCQCSQGIELPADVKLTNMAE